MFLNQVYQDLQLRKVIIMPTATKVNYSADDVQYLRATYNPKATQEVRDAQVDEICDKLGKGVRSVRSKLGREGLYVKKATVSKVTGAAPAKKDILAENLAALLVNAEGKTVNAESVSKMNKTDIQFITDTVTDLQSQLFAANEMLDSVSDESEPVEVEAETETE